MPVFDFLGFLLVIALFAVGGMWQAGKVKTQSAYLIANRHTGLFALVATLVVSELNTSTLLAFSSAGFFAGDWALTLPFVLLVGLTFYSLTVAKKYREFNVLSVAEVFLKKYGSAYARVVSVCLIIAMLGFCSTYVRSFALFFAPLLRINIWLLSLIMIAAVLTFTLRGGLKSIIRSDIIIFVVALFFLPLVFYWTLNFNESIPVPAISFTEGRQALTPNFVLSLIILTSSTYILAPWYGQKILSAKNAKVAYLSMAICAVFVFALYGLLVLSCSILQKKGVELTSPENALPFILSNVVPIGARGIGYALIFCIAATTLAGAYNAIATIIMSDFFMPRCFNIKQPIIITLTIASISYVLSNMLVGNIFDTIIFVNIPIFALSFALLAAFYWPPVTSAGAFSSTVVGLLWGLFCYNYFGVEGHYIIYWIFFGLPLVFGCGISVSLYSAKTYSSRI